jgi:hypothetical protein
MEKIFNQKNFNYFVWTPLGSRVNIYINFRLQFHFKDSAAWFCFHILPPVSLTPCRRYHWYRYRIVIPVYCIISLTTVANLPPVSLTPVVLLDLRREFSTKFDTVLMGYSGAGGKLAHEKNQKQKILWRCPFNMSSLCYFFKVYFCILFTILKVRYVGNDTFS